jgi:hypothetical protein
MSDMNTVRGPGMQLIELGEGLLSLGAGLSGAANNLQKQANAEAAARQAEIDAANKVLLEAGTYSQAGEAQITYQNGMNNWWFEQQATGETDPQKLRDGFVEAHNKFMGEARTKISLPQAQIQFDKFLADEFNKRQGTVQDYLVNKLEAKTQDIFEINRSAAVASGDFARVETAYNDAAKFLSGEQLAKRDDDVATAKYNSVYNRLASADPQFALDLLGNEKNAKVAGVDLSILTPEQLSKMTEDFQKKRDYNEAALKKTYDIQNGDKEKALAAAENNLLAGRGKQDTWLNWDMIAGFVGPDAGALEAKWNSRVRTALDSLKVDEESADKKITEQGWDIVNDVTHGWDATTKISMLNKLKGIPGADRAQLIKAVDDLEQNPERKQYLAPIQDYYGPLIQQYVANKEDPEKIAQASYEQFLAQQQMLDVFRKYPDNKDEWKKQLDTIMSGTVKKDVTKEMLNRLNARFPAFQWASKDAEFMQMEAAREQLGKEFTDSAAAMAYIRARRVDIEGAEKAMLKSKGISDISRTVQEGNDSFYITSSNAIYRVVSKSVKGVIRHVVEKAVTTIKDGKATVTGWQEVK